MTCKLYIIGNGFDIFHGVKSRYSDFKDFVESDNRELYELLEKYFNADELWSDFEETLAFIDVDTIVDDASQFLRSYGDEDWSDSYHHDYQYEIEKAIEVVTGDLLECFRDWILQLSIPKVQKMDLEIDSKYLTFNYTNTLEKNYNISHENILYIHNKAASKDSMLVLGHSRKTTKKDAFSNMNDEGTDPRVAEGNKILDQYFEDTYKNTETIIKENVDFFSELENVNEVFVLGHSISRVDIKYFQKVKEAIDEDAIWNVSYYGENEKQAKFEKVLNLGIKKSNIKMVTLGRQNVGRQLGLWDDDKDSK